MGEESTSDTSDSGTTEQQATTTDEAQDENSLSDAEKRAVAYQRRKTQEAQRELKKLQDELKAIRDKDLSETQKATQAQAAAEQRAADAEKQLLRVKVAAAKKLPAEFAERLRGDTEDEMAADADSLATFMKTQVRPSGDADQGLRGTSAGKTPAQEFAEILTQQMRR